MPCEFVAIFFQLPLDEDYVDKFSDQGSAKIDNSKLGKSLFSFGCYFIRKRLRHLCLTHEGPGDSGTVELLDGHPGRADGQSAALYRTVLPPVPGAFGENLADLAYAALFRARVDRDA